MEDTDRPSMLSRKLPEIEGFRVIREIGRGGMGVVYEAHETVLSRRVALKVLYPGAAIDSKHVERFHRESKAAARLHHTNIVPVFGVGEQGERHFYVMQYIEGQGLDAVVKELRRQHQPQRQSVAIPSGTTVGPASPLRPPEADMAGSQASSRTGADFLDLADGPPGHTESAPTMGSPPRSVPNEEMRRFPWDRAVSSSTDLSTHSDFTRPYFQCVARIGRQVAEALEYANRQGVLHRDIKPSNLLIDVQGNVWVTDFGLAKTADSDDLTNTGDLCGTLRYMAPERFEGRCDARSDVYALGLSLYELVALRPVFDELDRYTLMRQIQNNEPVRLRKLNAKVPLDLETIIHKSILREPGHRYPTAGALAEDLGRFIEGRTIQGRRTSMVERTGRWCRRNPWIAVSMVILCLGTTISTWQAVRASLAERTAWRAEEAAQKQKARAEGEAEISRAFNEFIKKDLLAQASAHNQALPDVKPDPDLKVTTVLDRAASKIGKRFARQPVVEASIRQAIGETFFQLGLYSKAMLQLQRVLELRQSALGENHPDTLTALNRLGSVYLADGKLADAAPLLVKAMDGLRSVLVPGDLQTLAAIHSVAQLRLAQGRLPDAERLLIQVRDGYAPSASDKNLELLDVTNSLAMVYVEQKKSDQARQLLEDVVRDFRLAVGGDHPFTLSAKNNLATVYKFLGMNLEAIRLLNEVLESKRSVLGNKHPDTLYAMVTLAECYLQQSNLERAEALSLEALEGCRTALDGNHEITDVALAMLSAVYSARGDLKKLGPVLLESLEITRSRYGPDHPLTFAANLAAGLFFLNQKEHGKAESCFRDRLRYLIKQAPEGKERFLCESQIGACLIAQKKYAEAELLLRSAYDGMSAPGKSVPAANQVEVRKVVEQIIELYDSWGKKEQADEWRKKREGSSAGAEAKSN